MLVKFCCCYDLRYGWIAYAVILLIFRITLPILLAMLSIKIAIFFIFWNLSVVGFMVMALRGAMKKKSILMYPSIVLTILEIILTIIIGIILSCFIHPFIALYVISATGLFTYYAITLYSMHAIFKYAEDSRSRRLSNPVELC